GDSDGEVGSVVSDDNRRRSSCVHVSGPSGRPPQNGEAIWCTGCVVCHPVGGDSLVPVPLRGATAPAWTDRCTRQGRGRDRAGAAGRRLLGRTGAPDCGGAGGWSARWDADLPRGLCVPVVVSRWVRGKPPWGSLGTAADSRPTPRRCGRWSPTEGRSRDPTP